MQLARAQALALVCEMKLIAGLDYAYELFDRKGAFVDYLNPRQIEELKEEDYIEYYLIDYDFYVNFDKYEDG